MSETDRLDHAGTTRGWSGRIPRPLRLKSAEGPPRRDSHEPISRGDTGTIASKQTEGSAATTIDDHRQNNLDLIRFVLASLVIFSHSYPLTRGYSQGLEPIAGLTGFQADGGTLAVNFFFVISGFLITQSWFASRSCDDFLRKRILRIFPGYIVAFIVSEIIAISCCPDRFRYLTDLLNNNDAIFRDLPAQ